MTLLLCAAPAGPPHCGIRGRHLDGCDHLLCGERCVCGCSGCLPRVAADGSRLCFVCGDRIPADADRAAELYGDLGLQLIGQRVGGERSGGTGAPVPNDEVMEARAAIRATLVGLARLITRERGFGLPTVWSVERLPRGFIGPPRRLVFSDRRVSSLAAFVGRSAQWLAAHPDAGKHSKDLRDLVTDRRTFRLAYPVGGRDRLYIGQCPLPGSDGGVCGTRLYQRADDRLVTCSGCEVFGSIEWWQGQLAEQPGAIVDASAGAAYLSAQWMRPVDPGVIRLWAHRGHVQSVGRDPRGRAEYNLADLVARAKRVWGDPAQIARFA